MKPIAVGSELWYRDIDYRLTSDEESKWKAYVVVKEGRTKLHIAPLDGSRLRTVAIDKATLRGPMRGKGYGDHQLYDKSGMYAEIWKAKHKHKVITAFSRCDDIDLLQRVALLVGYKP